MKAKIYAYLFFLSIVSVSAQQCCGMKSFIDWFDWFSTKPSTKPSAREDKEALFRAISKKDSKELKRLLEDELVNPNIYNQSGWTPLYVAVEDKFLDGIEMLLSAGADPNIANIDNIDIPLSIAVEKSFLQGAKLLLEKGADPNKKNSNFGNTPLYSASEVDMVDLLLKHGAKIDSRNNKGRTPLYSSWSGEPTIYFLKRGADPNVIDNEGNTPLSVALDVFRFDKAASLLKYGAYPDNKSRQQLIDQFDSLQNVLDEAVINDWHDETEIALAFGADKEAVDANGNTPLLKAVMNDSPVAAATLLAAGANIVHKNNVGQSAWSLKDQITPAMRRILVEYQPPKSEGPVPSKKEYGAR